MKIKIITLIRKILSLLEHSSVNEWWGWMLKEQDYFCLVHNLGVGPLGKLTLCSKRKKDEYLSESNPFLGDNLNQRHWKIHNSRGKKIFPFS